MYVLLAIVDANECEIDPDICGNNSICVIVPGSFSCHCQKGYNHTEDNSTYTDIYVHCPCL